MRLLAAGLLTTVQDLGRWGYQASGVPPAGPMDVLSHRWANRLVGNPDDAATLEITLAGPEIEFDDDAMVAVAGAAFALTVDGTPVSMHTCLHVPRGAKLRFGRRHTGARAYIAAAGGVASPLVLGSRATHLVSAVGGVSGRALRAGDVLPLAGASSSGTRVHGQVPLSMPTGGATLRVLPGAHEGRFSARARATFLGARYTIGAQSNRMAYRLEGPALAEEPVGELISDVTPMGGIQVPLAGLPILLMADRATTGGYPLIAHVISADLPLAGQLAPGDWIEFAVCTHAEAVRALIAQERALIR
jgi:antagonist of KipI